MRTYRFSWQMLPVLIIGYMITTAPPAQAKQNAIKLPAAEKFATVAAATGHCPGDTVVWSSLSSKAFHLSASRLYGRTKRGAYVCEKDALAAGFHASKR